MSKVFVLDTNKQPLNPIHSGRARMLLSQGKAAVFRGFPFTLILKEEVSSPDVKPLRIKIDPGAKTTGLALVNDKTGEVVWVAELQHRDFQIRDALTSRRQLRRFRRSRKTRYRKPRFLNRTRPKGWLPPSLNSRVANILTWVKRLSSLCQINAISQELVRFDTQQMENPEISGTGYQQGTLAGYEIREFLLEKWNRTCAYCGAKDTKLEIEHIQPRSKGGSNRVSNLCLACVPCNREKGNQDIKDFLKGKPDLLKRILGQAKRPLADTSAVNATRWNLYDNLRQTSLPVEVGTGGLTKYNRTIRGLDKTHYWDAACVGASTPERLITSGIKPLLISAKGHGTRQQCRTNKLGFPVRYCSRTKFHKGFQTGDIVKAVVTSGKKVGTYVGRVATRATLRFNISTKDGLVQGISHKYCKHIHKKDGYAYAY
ncbi:RNA-guided endonuclease IscB [Laspinema olomoucense]|uniref:RNA-guided endonuclease IscB n=1 Tax=Laspinema olomoucense D3b TaxID=2953688 RepID=A0ABT2N4I4_9CYAN|nr:RNA-guided endonuclease IscB [Laspinema sp. D3b]MCT7977562.1 RNA-guided endonuclease IscB [Laspinema sp. D3b]UZQ22131.1 HEARO endonuclease [uncultured bacterium]UZQ22151.1 HEARO endonuclease [uncultured bacterium]